MPRLSGAFLSQPDSLNLKLQFNVYRELFMQHAGKKSLFAIDVHFFQ
ncbi:MULTISPECIES: hypothetical protein [unclassified Methylobacter]|nr:hypothetical protein [Methylobacter sp. BlB1]MBF6648243.1 hypothetical protein [Methylobacter sp. BlB1]